MSENNDTNQTSADLISLLTSQLQSQQEAISLLTEEMEVQKANDHTNQMNLNSVGSAWAQYFFSKSITVIYYHVHFLFNLFV